ncbi:MAG: mannose-6-phosphate isomerase [Herbinix sp.]|nr:mannose-6-phosphate isomerase [Herbinix sp.]
MGIKNFYEAKLQDLPNCHDGIGILRCVELFSKDEFQSGIQFFHHTILPPNTTIGVHQHGKDEEIYIVLEGTGIMTLDDQTYDVKPGSVIVNKPHGSHGLTNTGSSELKLIVFEVAIGN